jgi:transcriptional regulator with XRE-family HTH domain
MSNTEQPPRPVRDTPGERLRDAREAAGYTQQSLADHLWGNKARASNIGNWERNAYSLSYPSAKLLADALGVTPEYLLEGSAAPDPCAPYAEVLISARQVVAAYERNPSSMTDALIDGLDSLRAQLDTFDAARQDREREEPTP